MTETQRKQIISYYENGTSIRLIRQLVEMTEGEFRKEIALLKKEGALKKRKTTEQKIVEAFMRGETDPHKIAQEYGVSYHTVRDYKKKNHIITGRPQRNYQSNERTLALWEEFENGNFKTSDLAEKYKVTPAYVRKLKRQFRENELCTN